MPQLALAFVGAEIGGAVLGAGAVAFGLTGAQIGFAAGSMLGSAIFAPTMKSSGPRLADLKATQVAYGSIISYVEGHPRIAGGIVWQSDKREVANTSEQGGKGGGGAEVTNYTYDVDMLIMLAENEVKAVRRIWMNGELAWSAADESDFDTLAATQNTDKWDRVTFYSGASDQLPDPTYEAAVGTGNAPAYRGRATIFFESMHLGASGQFPALTFELVQDPGDLAFGADIFLDNFAPTAFASSCPPGGATLDEEGVVRLAAILDAESVGGVDVYTGDGSPLEGDGVESSSAFPTTSGGTRTAGQGGGDRPFMLFGNSTGEVPSFTVMGDGVELQVTLTSWEYLGEADLRWATWDGVLAVASASPLGTGLNSPVGNLGNLGNVFVYNLTGTLLGTIAHGAAVSSMACTPDWIYVLSGGTVSKYDRSTFALDDSFAAPSGSGRRIFTTQQEGLACANAAAEIHTWDAGSWTQLTTMVASDATDLGTASCIHMVDGDVTYAIRFNSVATVEPYYRYTWTFRIGTTIPPAYRFRTFWEAVRDACGSVWDNPSYTTQPGPAVRPTRNRAFEVAVHNPANVYPTTTDPVAKLHMTMDRLTGPADGNPPNTWETVQATVVSGAAWLAKEVYTDKLTHYHQVWKQLPVLKVPLVEPTLQQVVERQCIDRAGLAEAYVDASALSTRNVRSMVLSQMTSPRGCVEMLSQAYFFDSVESGGVLKFKFRGGASVMDIPYEDLIATDPEAEPLPITRANDNELPVQVFVRYSNVFDDYQDGSEASDRLVSSSQNTSQVEFPLGFTPTEAKRIADAHVQDAPASRFRIGPFNLPRKYSALEPADVVTVYDAAGNAYRTRLRVGRLAGNLLTFEGVSDDADAIESSAVTSTGGYNNSTAVRIPVDLVSAIMDMPILRDADDNAGMYWATRPKKDVTFPGAALFKSADNVTFAAAAQAEAQAVLGTATTVLPSGPVGFIDEVNTLTVNVKQGELASITRDQLLDSTSNAMLVGSEVIQFRTATLVSTGIYTLSGLLRGQKGTEWAIDGHVADETVVLLNDALRRVPMELSEVGAARYFKPVALGRSTSGIDVVTVTDAGVGLKPYAPLHLRKAYVGGRNVFTWDRRTRLDCNLFAGTFPLGEETESYYCELLDGSNEVIATDTVEASGQWEASTSTSTLGQSYSASGWGLTTVGGSQFAIKDTIAPNFNDIRTVVMYTAEGLVAAESPSIGRQVYGMLTNGSDLYTCSADITSNTVPAFYIDGKIRRFALPVLSAPAATYTAATPGDPQGIAFDGTNIWITEFYGGNVRKLNASTLASVATYVLSTGIAAVTYDSGLLWIVCRGAAGSQVIKWDIATHTELTRFSCVSYPTDILIAGGKVFVQGETQLGVYNATTLALIATHSAGNASQLPQRNMVRYGSDVAVIDNSDPHASVIRVISSATGAQIQEIASPYWGTTALNGGSALGIIGYQSKTSAEPTANQLGGSVPDSDGAVFRVYQLSAAVGRGYPAEISL